MLTRKCLIRVAIQSSGLIAIPSWTKKFLRKERNSLLVYSLNLTHPLAFKLLVDVTVLWSSNKAGFSSRQSNLLPLLIASSQLRVLFEREFTVGISTDRALNDLLKDSTNGKIAIWTVIHQRTKRVNCWIRPLIHVSLEIAFRRTPNFYHACKPIVTTLFHYKMANIFEPDQR